MSTIKTLKVKNTGANGKTGNDARVYPQAADLHKTPTKRTSH